MPNKKEEQRKTHNIRVRLDAAQYDLIQNAASSAGMSISEYIRRQAVYGKVEIHNHIVAEFPKLGKTEFKYVKESTWRKNHKRKEPDLQVPELTIENYPYKDHIFCGRCGSKLTRHVLTANGNVVWLCSGKKHKGSNYCKGLRIPDSVIRGWGDITEDIYIRKDDKHGKRRYSYSCHKEQAREES